MRARLTQWLSAIPRWGRVALIAAAVVAAFIGIVSPLFQTSGPPAAEIDGLLPDKITAGEETNLSLAIDNTGASALSPVCVQISGAPVRLVSATFQGLDRATFRETRACGGRLSAQQTIGIRIALVATNPGPLPLSINVTQGAQVVGQPLRGTITVVSKP